MHKEKNKAKETTLEYWWNEFLFRKRYTFETEIPPEVVSERFRQLETEREGWFTEMWRMHRLESEVYYSSIDGDYKFDLKRLRRSRSMYITTARASGRIYHDQRGVTLISGEAKLGIVNHIMVVLSIGILLFVFSTMMQFGIYRGVFALFALAVISIMGFSWWRLLTDRNLLIEQIRQIVVLGKAKQ